MLKQHLMLVEGALLAIAVTACNASTSQPPAANSSPIASPSIVSSPAPTSTPAQSISSPTSQASPPLPGTADPSQQAAVQVIRDYYSAIDRQDYEQAYSGWGGNGAASQQSFEQFKRGFANTASTAVQIGEPGNPEGGAGSSYIEIPVTVSAVTRNGTRQRFRGSYVVRRVNDVPGSTPEQRRWHINSANISQVN